MRNAKSARQRARSDALAGIAFVLALMLALAATYCAAWALGPLVHPII